MSIQERNMQKKDISNKERERRGTWLSIGFWIVISLVFVTFFRPITIHGESMYPTFTTGDYVLIRTSFMNDEPIHHGDIVVFKSELLDDKNHEKMLIKRIIGLPGDNIVIKEGITYVNDIPVDHNVTAGNIDVVVPEGKYFVLGDNRNVSVDSRSPKVGMVDNIEIIGRVTVRVFPFWRIGLVE